MTKIFKIACLIKQQDQEFPRHYPFNAWIFKVFPEEDCLNVIGAAL